MSKTIQLLHSLLKAAVEHGISDVHLREDKKPYFRQKGSLVEVKSPPLGEQEMTEIAHLMIQDKDVLKEFAKLKEYDGSYQLGKICRVRFNFMRYQGKIGLVFRIIAMEVPTIEGLKLPDVIKTITQFRRGLVLVTGATGSGKSSTLAAIVESINQTRADHILTIEDPVEFLYTSKKSLITQREIGDDSESFLDALRGALRQDPDIILIGEMRDTETVNIAVKAAETGHLVFATVHTTNALTTIGRIVSMFPPEEQKEVRRRLADNIQATVSQRLLPRLKGAGRVCVQEVMVTSPGVKECIIGKEPMENIYTFIENGFREGKSQSFDQVLVDLVKKNMISKKVALDACTSKANFIRALEFGSSTSDDDAGDEGPQNLAKNNSGLQLDVEEDEDEAA